MFADTDLVQVCGSGLYVCLMCLWERVDFKACTNNVFLREYSMCVLGGGGLCVNLNIAYVVA